MNAQLPRQLGDYELLDVIGNGAQGQVFRARCVSSSNPNASPDAMYAVKILDCRGDDPSSAARIQRSVDLLRGLSHPNVVRYVDSFAWHDEWDEKTCLVMELLEGETLQAKLDRAPEGMDWDEIESIFGQCLAGLVYSLGRNVLHRDIKPSNIFVQRDGSVKLIDFGIARRIDAATSSTKGWRGSFDYMAPDFITGDAFHGDEQSDVFSLGACFYHAVTGRLPFPELEAPANIAYARRWQGDRRPAVSFHAPGFRVLTREAREFVRDSLHSDRAHRYAGFEQMSDAFRRIRRRHVAGAVDEYELLAVLGRGGFGEVYKARRQSDGKLLAVKWLFTAHQSRRFLREARLLKKSRHEHIVEYVDFIEIEEVSGQTTYFLVMEFLEGMPEWTLLNRIKSSPGGLPVKETIEIFAHYLEALQYLHDMDVIHRDIKPANLYAPEGNAAGAKIFDLGVARDIKGTVTTGRIPGTLNYMPPELTMAGHERGSPQSDLYSTGLSLYEALTGRRVFRPLPDDQGAAFREFMDRSKPGAAHSVNYSLPPFAAYPVLADILRRAIAPDPKDRFASAGQMRAAIIAVLADTPVAIEEAVTRTSEEPRAELSTSSTLPSSASHTAHTPSQGYLSGSGSGSHGKSAAPTRRRAYAIAIAVACAVAAAIIATALRPRAKAPGIRPAATTIAPEVQPPATPLQQAPAPALLEEIAPSAPLPVAETAPARAIEPQQQKTEQLPAPPLATPSPEQAPKPDKAPVPTEIRVRCNLAAIDNPPAFVEYRLSDSSYWDKLPASSPAIALPPGEYVFRISRPDYEPVEHRVKLRAGMDALSIPSPDKWTEKSSLAALRRIEQAWQAGEPNSAVLNVARIGPVPDFEWEIHSERYKTILAEWEKKEKASLQARLLAANQAVDEYLRWLYQVRDPCLGSYRRYREEPPDIAGPLAAIPDQPAGPRRDAAAPSERLLLWKTSATALRSEPGRKALADALAGHARKLRTTSPALALEFEFESALLRSRPGSLLPGFDSATELVRAHGQRAHAMFSPQTSCLDALKSMERYVRGGGRIDKHDIHMALLAAAYTWKNAIEGEYEYATGVNDSLSAVVGHLDAPAIAEAITYLEQAILGNRATDDDPCLYAMEALSFMPGLPDSSGMKPAARQWLAANGNNQLVAAKRAAIGDTVALLRNLLRVDANAGR